MAGSGGLGGGGGLLFELEGIKSMIPAGWTGRKRHKDWRMKDIREHKLIGIKNQG